jgi:Spx/MgsR family transcriptional regulator
MKLYGLPNCGTVKKVRAWLDEKGIAYTFHDFRQDGVNAALLRGWLAQVPREKLINRAGLTWRELSDDAKDAIQDDASALTLMLKKPAVIKRPVLEKEGKILAIGFNKFDYENLFK